MLAWLPAQIASLCLLTAIDNFLRVGIPHTRRKITCAHNHPIFTGLHTLVLSCAFFPSIFPLFSIVCALFDQKQGGLYPRPNRHRGINHLQTLFAASCKMWQILEAS